MEKMTSNITDIDPGQKLHFFITSLFSHNFFYNYEFFESSPSNIQLIDNVKVVKWWNPDILFRYGESVTRFELFKRRMKIGYSKFGESLVSAITILPSNFNDLERNVDIDAIYGDKIVVLTQKFAKLYYIVSKVIEAEKYDFFGQNSVITFTFVYKKSISMELYKVENGEISLLQRMEKRFLVFKESETELLSNIDSIQNHLNSGYEKSDLNVIFFDYNIANMDQAKYNEYFIIERKNMTEDDLMLAGAVFKAKSDFIGNNISFVDITERTPYFNMVYKLLKSASNYQPKTEAFGIDLGTSRSALAVHRFLMNENILHVVPDQDDSNSLLYSWIAFDQRENKKICGKTVYDRFYTRGDYIIYDCKKIIGKKYDDIEQNEHWRFEVMDDKKGGTKIKVKSKDDAGEDTYKFVTPEEVYAIMLERFQSNAIHYLSTNIKKAVFTVPSNFTEKQKNAMQKAATLANIEVLRFIPEPTAAALNYCSAIQSELGSNEKIFVFDLGGGTFDISIFEIKNSNLIELCQHSDMKLGGSNFTEILFKFFKETFIKEHNLDLTKKKSELLIKSIDAKEVLTELPDINLHFPKEMNEDADITITRDEFEELAADLLKKIRETIEYALKKGKVEAEDITLVIKVGGSCAMPMIKSLIKDIFPKSEIKDRDPQLEVALGAALYASTILPQKKIQTDFIKNYWPL